MVGTHLTQETGREKLPNPIDIHVGRRVRLMRTMIGMSQEDLGEALGLAFQQVQKYERGMNRVSASRLYDLSRVLDVPISFFFDDLPDHLSLSHRPGDNQSPPSNNYVGDSILPRRETLELSRAYYGITNLSVRKRMLDLMKALAVPSKPIVPTTT